MDLVLSAPALAGPGGVQSYVLVVGAQLQRLGHEVRLHAPVGGVMAREAARRGLPVSVGDEDLPAECDAVLAQDAPSLLAMADRYPHAVRGIVVHGPELDLHLPPAVAGLAGFAVALNDVVARRVRALAAPPTVIRLRQPVDTLRLAPARPLPARPGRVLLLGNYLDGARRERLRRVCREAGLACRQVGVHAEYRADPARDLAGTDVVVGVGRSIVEAMAAGRAAWVYSGPAGDGWVTPAGYPALEADGFRGRATRGVLDAEAFRRGLEAYEPGLGEAGRSLAVQHHRDYEHTVALVEALQETVPARPAHDAPLRELARTIRAGYDAQVRAEELLRDLEATHRDLEAAHRDLTAARAENARLRAAFEAVTGTRRWRVAQGVARPLDAARRTRRRP